MSEFLAKFSGGEMIGFASVVGGLLLAAIGVMVVQWRRVRVAELEVGLKQQMLEKGMSAVEIEQVMNAGRPAGRASSTAGECRDKGELVQQLIDNGYEGEDIERVLKAYQEPPKQGEKPVKAPL